MLFSTLDFVRTLAWPLTILAIVLLGWWLTRTPRK
jgi:hypothetical protein